MRARTPSRWSQNARTRPVGPAPAISTSVSDIACLALLLSALNPLLGGGMGAQILEKRARLFLRMQLQTKPAHQVGERLRRLAVPLQHCKRVVIGLRFEGFGRRIAGQVTTQIRKYSPLRPVKSKRYVVSAAVP